MLSCGGVRGVRWGLRELRSSCLRRGALLAAATKRPRGAVPREHSLFWGRGCC